MENDQTDDTEAGELEANAEFPKRVRAGIYVASLADYNNGVLHGAWIDADDMPEIIERSIQDMLARSPTGSAEEFAILDYDGFSGWQPDEYESIATVSMVAQGMAEYGNAFAHWVSLKGSVDPDDQSRFEDSYLGHWPSVTEYAQQLLEGMVDIDRLGLPDSLGGYVNVDYAGFGRDLELSGDVMTSEGDSGVYVFDGRQ